MNSRLTVGVGGVLVACVLASATACSGSTVAAGPSAAKTLQIASDLPLQGDVKAVSTETNQALQLYLEQVQNRAGRHTVSFKTYDDATAARGGWDDETCVKNAHDHLRSEEVAVIGTYNSGCARLMVPVMNEASDGPLLMVSHANSNPGLTKAWGPREPAKFAPSGTRNYARVAVTDDQHGNAAVSYLHDTLHVKRCYVLNDGQLYGKGVAQAFVTAAAKQGLTVLGNQSWDLGQTSYLPLFRQLKALGPECVYLAGVFENKGKQVITDKVAVLGDNAAVPLMASDGFAGYPELDALPSAQGMYLTFGGLDVDQMTASSPAAKSFVAAYQARYGTAPTSGYVLYGVAALQVVLAAVASSDGTRAGVNTAVFGPQDLTVPASQSITGQALTIDRRTGDLVSSWMTVLHVRNGKEVNVSAQKVS